MKPALREPPALLGYLEGRRISGAARALSAGGIAILATDTLYGFHCAVSRPEAIERIRRLKGKPEGAGFIVLGSDLEMLDALVSRWPRGSRAILAAIWPAPFTAVLPASSRVSVLAAPRGSVAIRIPAHDGLRRVIRALGEPIVSTSVNVSGGAPMTRIAEIRRAFPGLAAYLSRRGSAPRLPSTVVDFTGAEPRLARPGRYAWPCAGGTGMPPARKVGRNA